MNNSKTKGFTFVEIMVSLLIITIALVTLSSVFTAISKSLAVSKNRTLATNLAQEKIESLKNFSYYRLLVTTASNLNNPPNDPSPDTNFPDCPNMEYDIGTTASYYPEETLTVAGITFKRRVFVEYLKEEGKDLTPQTWTANDTGIKRITVYVVWQEGAEWKKVELRNMRNNPDRAQLEYSFTGKVTSGPATAGISIYNALVETIENPSYYSRTSATGEYSFKVQPGTYTLRATATGYFMAMSTSYVVSVDQTGSSNQNFGLRKMETGQTTGYAYIRDHLVIAQVVASHDEGGQSGQEWVELYNPTTYNILIASRSVPNGSFDIFFVTVTWFDSSGQEPPNGNSRYLVGVPGASGSKFSAFRSTSTHWTVDTPTISIPSNSYFLISNFSTVAYNVSYRRIADAYYDDGDGGNQIDASGGIRVTGDMGHSYNERTDWHDGVAWGSASGITKAKEGSHNTNQLNADGILHRLVKKEVYGDCLDSYTNSMRSQSPFFANAFDSNNNGSTCGNGSDFNYDSVGFLATSSGLANADVTMLPLTGTPARGASVSVNDGLSAVAYVQDSGSFTVTGIATGAWTVTISSGYYSRDISTLTITPSLSTSIPNNSTNPPWEFYGFPAIRLTSSTIYGYVSGRVIDAKGNPLSGVTISAPGVSSVYTDTQGKYRLSIDPSYSPITITVSKSQFTTESVDNISVTLGVVTDVSDIQLISAGTITGFVTTNGSASGALPGIPVVATDPSSTTVLGSAVTGVDGMFLIPSIPTGTYIVSPQLESGETCVPTSVSTVVTINPSGTPVGTFIVSNAYGKITGTVGTGSSISPITTGVLVVASTQTITTDKPPDINSSVILGSVIYYAVSSDSTGRYSLPVRGNASYYIYGWYPQTLEVNSSSAPKRQVTATSAVCPNCHWVEPGKTIDKNIQW